MTLFLGLLALAFFLWFAAVSAVLVASERKEKRR
jgi:hypothetical protein